MSGSASRWPPATDRCCRACGGCSASAHPRGSPRRAGSCSRLLPFSWRPRASQGGLAEPSACCRLYRKPPRLPSFPTSRCLGQNRKRRFHHRRQRTTSRLLLRHRQTDASRDDESDGGRGLDAAMREIERASTRAMQEAERETARAMSSSRELRNAEEAMAMAMAEIDRGVRHGLDRAQAEIERQVRFSRGRPLPRGDRTRPSAGSASDGATSSSMPGGLASRPQPCSVRSSVHIETVT